MTMFEPPPAGSGAKMHIRSVQTIWYLCRQFGIVQLQLNPGKGLNHSLNAELLTSCHVEQYLLQVILHCSKAYFVCLHCCPLCCRVHITWYKGPAQLDCGRTQNQEERHTHNQSAASLPVPTVGGRVSLEVAGHCQGPARLHTRLWLHQHSTDQGLQSSIQSHIGVVDGLFKCQVALWMHGPGFIQPQDDVIDCGVAVPVGHRGEEGINGRVE